MIAEDVEPLVNEFMKDYGDDRSEALVRIAAYIRKLRPSYELIEMDGRAIAREKAHA